MCLCCLGGLCIYFIKQTKSELERAQGDKPPQHPTQLYSVASASKLTYPIQPTHPAVKCFSCYT